ncbi:PilX N-terminal domain-containing pilus assembly protein [Stutzerimonas zhaodongensis]|uniref:pilus assembly PilX family protein n=1 Tax=Stutzerimonas zhaodongensis TaxID=1176257 RepID=UPI0039EEDE9B
MNRNFHYPCHRKQQGVTLVVALVFLLIITVLALANMREVSLESRITGNMIEQKRLLNTAEAATRDGERRTVLHGPHEPTSNCNGLAPKKRCLLLGDNKYSLDSANGAQIYSPDDETEVAGRATWYAKTAPGGETQGQTENPEYGNMLLGFGVFRYEINGMASHNELNNAVRSTVALNAKGRIEQAD